MHVSGNYPSQKLGWFSSPLGGDFSGKATGPVSVGESRRPRSFPRQRQVFTVGRAAECDVQTTGDLTASRIGIYSRVVGSIWGVRLLDALFVVSQKWIPFPTALAYRESGCVSKCDNWGMFRVLGMNQNWNPLKEAIAWMIFLGVIASCPAEK